MNGLEGLLKHIAEFLIQHCVWGRSWDFACLTSPTPGAAGATGLGTTLWEPQISYEPRVEEATYPNRAPNSFTLTS